MTISTQKKYSLLSLFSGCGGLDLGFKKARFEIIGAIDNDQDACTTYQKNIGSIIEKDIREMEWRDWSIRKRPDVLAAGFPCQPFSNAGSRKGVLDKRGTLYRHVLKYVEHYEPRIILLENVRGLLTIKHGKRLLIEQICQDLRKLGYTAFFKLIDASHHRVPQRRLRVFIVGLRSSLRPSSFDFPSIMNGKDLSLGATIMDIPDETPNQNEFMPLNPQAIKLGNLVPEGGSWKDIETRRLPPRLKKIRREIVRYRWPNFYRKYAKDEIAGTITAAFKPENAGVWHPVKNRVLSVREVARIQTFPDSFQFYGRNVQAKYRQIGNAVPPRLAFFFAKRFLGILQRQTNSRKTRLISFEEFRAAARPLKPTDPGVIYDYK